MTPGHAVVPGGQLGFPAFRNFHPSPARWRRQRHVIPIVVTYQCRILPARSDWVTVRWYLRPFRKSQQVTVERDGKWDCGKQKFVIATVLAAFLPSKPELQIFAQAAHCLEVLGAPARISRRSSQAQTILPLPPLSFFAQSTARYDRRCCFWERSGDCRSSQRKCPAGHRLQSARLLSECCGLSR